jgi:hypothetical protein
MREPRRHPVKVTTLGPVRWKHVTSATMQAFFVVFAATFVAGFVLVMAMFPSPLAMAAALGGSAALAGLAAAGTAYAAHRHHVRDERRLAGRCLGCGYDLQHSEARCPECGHTIDENVYRAVYLRRRVRKTTSIR